MSVHDDGVVQRPAQSQPLRVQSIHIGLSTKCPAVRQLTQKGSVGKILTQRLFPDHRIGELDGVINLEPLMRVKFRKGIAPLNPNRFTSGPSILIRALWMPQPAMADIKCSIVETSTPSSLDTRVLRTVSLTRSQRAGTFALRRFTSIRSKTIPCPTGAGDAQIRAGRPLCSPVPTSFTSEAKVCCTKDLYSDLYKKGLGFKENLIVVNRHCPLAQIKDCDQLLQNR